MLQQTFFQKLMLMIICGFCAACMVWVFRHIVLQSFWESGEGWKESLYGKQPPAKKTR